MRRTSPLPALSLLLLVAAQQPAPQAPAPAVPQETVGMPGKIENLILPGGELEAAPAPPHTPIVLRLLAVRPHGSLYRYDLEFTGFEPGAHDLRPYLRRKDGAPTTDLPPIPVQILPVLPVDELAPRELQPTSLPRVGGYSTWLVVAIVGWVAGLLAILRLGRRQAAAGAGTLAPVTLADRLRPLVEDALADRLQPERLAELERLLLSWWRDRLGLHQHPAAEAVAALRAHPEAGELLRQLDAWLHEPPGRARMVDVNALLRPYQTPAAPGGAA